jgi:hypothetical protein
MTLLIYAAYLGVCCTAVGFNLLARKRGLRPRAVYAVNAAGALTVFAGMMRLSEPPEWLSDFRKAYYAAGGLVLRDPVAMYAPDRLAFVNLPVVAYLFTPFAALSIRLARYLFMLLGLAACAAAWGLLARTARASGWRRAALAGLFVLCGPLCFSLREGNLTHFALLALAGAVACLESRREVCLGVCLAAAGLMKPPLLLLAAHYGLRRRWRVVAGCAGPLLLIAGASLVLVGVEAHRAWLDRCIFPYAARPMTDYNVQSPGAVLGRLLTDGAVDNDWRPVEVGGWFRVLHWLLLLTLVAGPLLAWLRPAGHDPQQAERLDFCMVLCLAVVASPVSWTHYYLLLLVPAGLWLAGRLPLPRRSARAAWPALSWLLMSPPVLDLSASGGWGRLLVSHYWAGGVLLLGALAVARWRLGVGSSVLRLYQPSAVRAGVALLPDEARRAA